MTKLTDEDIARLLAKTKRPEYNRKYKGFSPMTVEKNGKVVSGLERNVKGGRRGWHNPGSVATTVDWGLDPLKKRSERERAESLSKRLFESAVQDPAQLELLLKRVQAEYWKQGRTYSYDDIRKVADELMREAAAKEAERNRRKF